MSLRLLMGSGDGEVAPGYAIDPVRKLLTLRITGGGEVRSGAGDGVMDSSAGGGVSQSIRTGTGTGILTV